MDTGLYVIASYGIALVLIGGLAAGSFWRARSIKRALAQSGIDTA